MNTSSGVFEGAPPVPAESRELSPTRILVNLAVMIFLSEMVSMTVLYFLDLPNYLVVSLLDGLMMILLILPALYYLQLHPLRKQIEERSRAERALRANEGLLRKVMELLPVGVWVTDKGGNIVHGNPASKKIWGGARYVGIDRYGEYKSWWVKTGKRIEPEEWGGARAVHHGETSLNEEVEIETFDGTHKIILNSSVPILDENKAIQGAIIVNQEITQIRRVEKDLLQTNELMERFFRSTYTLIAYLDLDFNFIRVNAAYASSGGYPEDFFIGKNHFDLYPDEENKAIFQKVVATGEPFSVTEKPFEYPDHPEWGVTYWDWSLQPVKGADGAVEGIVFSLVDATERMRARILLEQQNQELRDLTASEHKQRELAEGLVRSTIAVSASLQLQEVFDTILEQIHRAIPFKMAAVALVENRMVRVAGYRAHAVSPELAAALERSHPLDNYPVWLDAYSTGESRFIPDTREFPVWQIVPGMEWVLSFAVTPLISRGQVIGFINLASDQPGFFDQEISARLTAFAVPAALAIQNARLYRTELHARQVAETLSAAAQALTRALDLEQVVGTLLDHTRLVVDSDTAGVTLLEDETYPTPIAVRGYGAWAGKEHIPAFPIEGITDSTVRRILSTRKSCVIPKMVPASPPNETPGPEPNFTWLVVPIIASDKVIGLVELGRAGEVNFDPELVQFAEALVGQAAVAVQKAWLFQQVRSSNERLQSLAHKLVEIQENERAYIARELHDEAGQVLSSLKMSLGRLEHDPECPPFVRERLQELKIATDCVLDDLHRLAMNLRPAALDHLGLAPALQQYTGSLNTEGLTVKFKALGFGGKRLPPELETALYRIVQEALTNVVRHAQATSVAILLERSAGKVKVFIEDDGVGFSTEPNENKDRIGLIGMRERVEMFGGNLTIESSIGEGTSIIMEVPDGSSDSDRG